MKKNVRVQSSYLTRLMTVFACTWSFPGTTPVEATQYAVTNILDSGPGSLRDAMFHAVSGDSIIFAPTLMGVIALQSPLPWINGDLSIQGPLVGNIVIDGMNQNQIFFANKGTISISNFTLKGGLSKGGDGGLSASGNGGGALGAGGALFVDTGVNVTLDNMSIISCSAQGGAGGDYSNLYFIGTGGGGGGGFNGGSGGDGGANFGTGGGGGGGGGFASDAGNAMEGGGGGGGVSAMVAHRMINGAAQNSSGYVGGDGGLGYSGAVAQGGTNALPGQNANPSTGGGGGGGGGVNVASINGGNGGSAGTIGGGGGGGGGAKGGLGGAGMDFGGGAGGAGTVNSKTSARGGFGGFGGGGGGGGGGIMHQAGGHGAKGGFGGGGGGGGFNNEGGAGGADLGGNGGNSNGGGGGGAALGGAIFVRSGATLKMKNSTLGNNNVVGGGGGQNNNPGLNGKAKGRDVYIMNSAVVFLESVQSHSKMGLHMEGDGTVVYDAADTNVSFEATDLESNVTLGSLDDEVENSLVFMTKENWETVQQGT